MGQTIIYGPGGYDPSKENDNIVAIEEYDDDLLETTETEITITSETLAALEAELTTATTVAKLKTTLANFVENLKG